MNLAQWIEHGEVDEGPEHDEQVSLRDQRAHLNEPVRIEVIELTLAESERICHASVEASRRQHEQDTRVEYPAESARECVGGDLLGAVVVTDEVHGQEANLVRHGVEEHYDDGHEVVEPGRLNESTLPVVAQVVLVAGGQSICTERWVCL